MTSMSRQSSLPTIAAFFCPHGRISRGHEPLLGYIRDGELHWRTWQEVADAAASLAAELRAAGIAPGDRVAHVSENRYEWIITDLALHLAAAVHVPIHVTLSGPQIAEQIRDSGAKLAFVSNQSLTKIRANLRDQRADPVARRIPAIRRRPHRRRNHRAPNPQSLTPTTLATILYTSGTTGRPRGVMLSHENLASNAAAVCESAQSKHRPHDALASCR